MTDFETKARMFAALSATNEAILKARSADELYTRVCEAAVEGGRFRSAAAMFPNENQELEFKAFVGQRNVSLEDYRIPLDPASRLGQGITAQAFRERRSKIANQFQTDHRSASWLRTHRIVDIGSAAA